MTRAFSIILACPGSTDDPVRSSRIPLSIDALDAFSHDRNGTFHRATSHRISIGLPLLIITDPVVLSFKVPYGIHESGRYFSIPWKPALHMLQLWFTLACTVLGKQYLILLFAPQMRPRCSWC
jgi:hypothetical protein